MKANIQKSDLNSNKNNKDYFHGELATGAIFQGPWDIPYVESNGEIPSKVIPFSKCLRSRDFDCWIIFYEDDRQFERLWKSPKKYLPILRKFQGVVGPDFSLYGDYPLPIQLYNTYRSRIITHWLKFNNIKVIPNIRWSTKHSYSFCFDGLKKGDVVFVGSHGCSKRKGDKKTFDAGFREMVNRLNPSTICVYGKTNRPIFAEYRELGINIIGFQSEFSSVHKRS